MTTIETSAEYDVAEEVARRRPDLDERDVIATVLTQDPTLTADEVIEILDEATEEWARERAYQAGIDRRERDY